MTLLLLCFRAALLVPDHHDFESTCWRERAAGPGDQ